MQVHNLVSLEVHTCLVRQVYCLSVEEEWTFHWQGRATNKSKKVGEHSYDQCESRHFKDTFQQVPILVQC